MPDHIIHQENLQTAYLRWLMEQQGAGPLAELGQARTAEPETRLDLPALYIMPRIRRPAPMEIGGRRAERAVEWPPVMEFISAHKRLMVLGDPGAGKSALIDMVTLCLAGERLGDPQANLTRLTAGAAWPHGALLPVKVVLREFSARMLLHTQQAGGETLWNFTVSSLPQTLLNFAPALRQVWTDEGGLLLLDGLDEVPDSRREAIQAAVQGFGALFPKVRMLATCRPAAYQAAALKLSGFAEARLAPFSSDQIRQFAESWFSLTRPGNAHAAAFLVLLERSPRLAELAHLPLNLTLLAAFHTWGGGPLPDQAEALYAAVTSLLFEQWAGRNSGGTSEPLRQGLTDWLTIEPYALQALLQRLACEALTDRQALNGRVELSQEKLMAAVLKLNRNGQATPAQLADYLRASGGLLGTTGDGFCAFPHRAFQDYAAACHLTDMNFPDALAERLRADPATWREVTLLAGAKAARGVGAAAWMLAEALCPPAPPPAGTANVDPATEANGWGALLAAQVLLDAQRGRLAEIPPRYQATADRIRGWLIHMLAGGRFVPADAVQAGDVLAAFGDARFRADAWQLPNDPMLGFVEIPAGPALLGSDRQRDSLATDAELPQHSADLPRYFIAQYPVTVAQFRAFVEASGYEPRDKTCLQGVANHPAVRVTVHDVVKYCEWLTETLKQWEGTPEAIAKLVRGLGWRVTVPSEAEWEKAARGATGRLYPWGDDANVNAANYAEAGLGHTTTVGCFPAGASPYGCLDMAGNVWEWTRSAHKPYPYDRRDGREDLRSISFLVMRGGGYDDDLVSLRCAGRSWYYLAGHFKDGGFRLALSTAKL